MFIEFIRLNLIALEKQPADLDFFPLIAKNKREKTSGLAKILGKDMAYQGKSTMIFRKGDLFDALEGAKKDVLIWVGDC